MKVLLLVLGALVLLVAVVLLVGALLPRKHLASREIVLRQAPADVYAVVRDFAATPAWRSDLKRVEMLENAQDRVGFREESQHGVVTYEVVEELPAEKLVTRIVDQDLGYSGSWTYQFVAADNGTRIRITEDGDVPNVFFRFMSRFVFGHTATMETYLKNLGRKFGEDVVPK